MNGMEKRKGYQQGVDIRLITHMELCLSRGKGKFPLDCSSILGLSMLAVVADRFRHPASVHYADYVLKGNNHSSSMPKSKPGPVGVNSK